jgi:5-methylcytosine-specific restriction protein A
MKTYNKKINIDANIYCEPINIDTNTWDEILNNKQITDEKILDILLFLLDSENYECCGGEIARKLNLGYPIVPSKTVAQFSKKILKHYPKIKPPRWGNDTIQYWHIPFMGRGIKMGRRTKKRYNWILRKELKEALLLNYNTEKMVGKLPEEFIDEIFWEGKQKKHKSNIYERNSQAREACLKHYGYTCQVCGFDFEKYYGIAEKKIIHVHHINKISEEPNEHQIDPIKELIPVCPNCHIVIHSKKEGMYTIKEMKELIHNK